MLFRSYLMAVSDRHRLDSLFDLSLCTEEFGVGSADEMFAEIMHYHEVNPSAIGKRLMNVGARVADSTQAWNAHEWDLRA